MQVLGLLGKILTGPWMQKFYTNADSETDHIQGISLVQNVIDELKKSMEDPFANLNLVLDTRGQRMQVCAFPPHECGQKRTKLSLTWMRCPKNKLEQVVTWAIGMARKEEIKSKETGRDKRGTF